MKHTATFIGLGIVSLMILMQPLRVKAGGIMPITSPIVTKPTVSFSTVTCYTRTKISDTSLISTKVPLTSTTTTIDKTVDYTVVGPYKYLVDDNGNKADYKKIQDALDASSNYDTIYVCPGVYQEHITIAKSVKLIGIAGAATTTIDASTAGDGTVVDVSASATVQGFTITGARHDTSCFYGGGIGITGTLTSDNTNTTINHPIIQQNIIIENDACQGADGIEISGASKSGGNTVHNEATVRNNIVHGGLRIVCSKADGSIIENNTVLDGGIGLDDNGVCSRSVIMNNIATTISSFNIVRSTATVTYVLNSTCEYNDIYDSAPSAHIADFSATNMSVDPVFVDTDRYRLDATSPLKNAGDPDTSFNDFDSSRNDIGAYGGKRGNW